MRQTVLLLTILSLVALPAVGQAAPPKMFVSTAGPIKTCDHFHHEESCSRYHIVVEEEVDPSDPVATASRTTVVLVEGDRYEVTWSGKGYRLEAGPVVAETADGTWMQVYPNMETVRVDDWTDVDGNAYLTSTDTITVNGSPQRVKEALHYAWLNRL